jgi:hypothetical protein
LSDGPEEEDHEKALDIGRDRRPGERGTAVDGMQQVAPDGGPAGREPDAGGLTGPYARRDAPKAVDLHCEAHERPGIGDTRRIGPDGG